MKARDYFLLAFALAISFFLDQPVAEFAQSIRFPLLDKVMGWFSQELSVFFVLVVIAATFMYEEKKAKYVAPLFISFFASMVVSYLLKFVFMRIRPEGILYVSFSVFDFAVRYADYSFPSSHAAIAFSVLPVLDKEFRKIKSFWILFSVIIAASRIYLNYHHLSDVIAGSILGYAIGMLVLKQGAKNGIHKKNSPDI